MSMRQNFWVVHVNNREGLARGESLYFTWPKVFFEIGKKRSAGDTAHPVTNDELLVRRTNLWCPPRLA